MNEASSLPAPDLVKLDGRSLTVNLPVNGLAIVTIPVMHK
jgi:hypothetical protein